MPHTLYNLAEVAAYLHVPESDVEMWARRAEIPCERRGDRYVFRRSEIELWASCRLLGGTESRLKHYHEKSSAALARGPGPGAVISVLLRPERIDPAMTSRTRASVIRDLVGFAERTGLLNYPADLLRCIDSREKENSTALPGGVALLHPGHREPYLFEDSFLLLGRTVQAIPFGAPDGRATDLFFLVCCSDGRLHLHVLARLCLLCFHSPMLGQIRAAADADGIFGELTRAEEAVLAAMAARRMR
jgi:PTS system nitrogen regulatory IIA component